MAPHSSTLAWKIPRMEEGGRLQSMGSRRVGHDWVTSLSLFTFLHWRRKWQPTPVFLPGESQGWGSLVAAVYGVTQSRTRLKWLSSSSSSIIVVQLLSWVWLCDPMDCSTPGFPVLRYLPEFSHIDVRWVCDAIQPSHPLPPLAFAFNLSQHRGLFQWVQVAKVLELQLQHQSFQWTFRIELWYDPRIPLLDIYPCWYKNMYMDVHSSSIHNEQNMETTQMSISWWMDTQMYIHPKEYHSAKKKWSTDICYHVHESWKHYAKWKKPDTKGYILHYYI